MSTGAGHRSLAARIARIDALTKRNLPVDAVSASIWYAARGSMSSTRAGGPDGQERFVWACASALGRPRSAAAPSSSTCTSLGLAQRRAFAAAIVRLPRLRPPPRTVFSELLLCFRFFCLFCLFLFFSPPRVAGAAEATPFGCGSTGAAPNFNSASQPPSSGESSATSLSNCGTAATESNSNCGNGSASSLYMAI